MLQSRTSRDQAGDNLIQCPEVTSSQDEIAQHFERLDRFVFEQRRLALLRLRLTHNRNIMNRYPNPVARYPDPRLRDPAPQRRESTKEEVLGSTRVAVFSVIVIFLCSVFALLYVYANFPELEPNEKKYIKIPWDIEDAKNLGKVLDRYKDKYFFEVLSGVCITYIFLQTFAIPGSLFLSILSGFLFPFIVALILVCTCSAIGASLCFLLSQLLGRRIVFQYFPDRARTWAKSVTKHKDNLLNYMLFLRITPFVPNWFINLTAPIIGVPLYPFVLGTFLGVAPPSFVAIQAGQTLYNMTSSNDAFSWTSVTMLTVFAILSIIPVLFREKLKEKFD